MVEGISSENSPGQPSGWQSAHLIHLGILTVSTIFAVVYCQIQYDAYSWYRLAVEGAISILLCKEWFDFFKNRDPRKAQSALPPQLLMIGVIYLTGGATSPFVVLLLPQSMLIGLRNRQELAIVQVVSLAALYSLLIFGMWGQVIPPSDGNITTYIPGGIVLHLIGVSSALILLTVSTSYLARDARIKSQVIMESRKEVADLQLERDQLLDRLKVVEDRIQAEDEIANLMRKADESTATFETRISDFVGESKLMQQVFKLITRVAPTDATTLITGESGTGKELVARAIHLGSKRADEKFVVVNCGAIPESLMESEFFGHKKGSFTGAIGDHRGLFEEANHGTLFLDEIGELPLAMQVKLLRALQERTIRPVGSSRDIPLDVRVVAATNRTLKQEVKSGKFREDLYYRLNVVSIHLPALRERKEDLPYLTSSILRKFARTDGTPTISPSVMKILMDYNYPGNVRELENIIERATVLSGDMILPEHLPENLYDSASSYSIGNARVETTIIESDSVDLPVQLDLILAQVEKRFLEAALSKTNGAKKRAAELLGINFRSFRYRLQKFGMSEDSLSD